MPAPIAPAPARRRPLAARIVQCAVGLALFGIGIALIFRAELGRAPWDVLHEGLSDLTGIDVGPVIVLVGVVLLVLWIPLRERPGLGTAMNAVLIGVVFDLVEPRLPDVEALAPRLALLAGGIVIVGAGSGIYIRADLGAGPRDGLMTGLARVTPLSIRTARTLVEVVALLVGVALGGRFGVGTLAFAVTIGPLVQVALKLTDALLGTAPAPVPWREPEVSSPSPDTESY